MTNELDFDRVRRLLLAEKQQLQGHVDEALAAHNGTAHDGVLGRNPDRTALAGDYADRERDRALSAIEMEQIAEIDAALLRIDDGTYGICVDCGEPITPGRLEILPYATRCVSCQAQRKAHF